ncbi:MAG: PPA1309 family protein [Jatrophihabitans sp.]
MLEAIAAEIEAFVGTAGWDRPPTLFALVPTRLLAADPAAAALLGEGFDTVEGIAAESITPVAQDELPDAPLDEALAQIGWPDEVIGCALSQEIVMLPPAAEPELDDLSVESATSVAAEHPERREARLVVAVLRDGQAAGMLRLRGSDDAGEDLLTGPDLAPNLVTALSATLLD